MSFDLTQKIKVVNPTSNIDELYGPYTSVVNALTGVPIALRQLGRTVGIIEGGIIQEYWFKNGITNGDLVLKIAEVNPVSATQSGIVNNSPLQELGGVDKLINEVRIGKGAGTNNDSVVLGKNSLINNTTGTFNTAIGSDVLETNTSGSYNTGLGWGALINNSTGSNNTAIGQGSLFSSTNSTNNTAVGVSSLTKNTTGSSNVAVGSFSLSTNIIGSRNTAVGTNSLLNTTAGDNTGIGSFALWKNTTGSYNCAFGSTALLNNTTGSNNVAVGVSLYHSKTGSRNTSIGFNAGYAVESGAFNLYMGSNAAYDNGVGSYNVALGYGSLAIASAGYTSGGSTVNLNRNVFIGSMVRPTAGMNDTFAVDNKGATVTNAADALLYGGFSVANRFLNIGGKLSVTPSYMPNATVDETKKVLWNPTTGVFAVTNDITPPTISANKQRFTGDTISAKTLTQTPKPNSVAVILNGLELDEQGGDYTVSGTTVTLANEPLTTDVIVIKYLY